MLNPPLLPPLNDQEYVWTSSQVNILINGAFNWIIDHIGYADIEGICREKSEMKNVLN